MYVSTASVCMYVQLHVYARLHSTSINRSILQLETLNNIECPHRLSLSTSSAFFISLHSIFLASRPNYRLAWPPLFFSTVFDWTALVELRLLVSYRYTKKCHKTAFHEITFCQNVISTDIEYFKWGRFIFDVLLSFVIFLSEPWNVNKISWDRPRMRVRAN